MADDVDRHRAQRNNLTAEQIVEMNRRRRERAQIQGLNQPNRRNAYNWRDMDPNIPLTYTTANGFLIPCAHCNALYSLDERNTNNRYTKCCMNGNYNINIKKNYDFYRKFKIY